MSNGISAPDPYKLSEPYNIGGLPLFGSVEVNGRALRSLTLNTGIRNLILIVAGQSNAANNLGTLFVPTNASAIDNLSIIDGAPYDVAGPMLGANTSSIGPGNIGPRVADLLISNGKFDRVILVTIAIGSTAIANWGSGGFCNERLIVAMRRLAARGWVAGTNVTTAMLWMQGETDTTNGTSQAAYQASWAQVVSTIQAAGFTGRFFVCQESWSAGSTSSAVRAAQAAVVDNITVFSGGDLDTLGAGSRSDNTHFTPTGAASAATLIYNAMHASGAPY